MVTLLSDILDSKQPADLLAFFLVAPLRSFSSKELAVRLDTTTGKLANSLRLLEENNFLKVFIRNHTKFFMLNMRHPQVEPLRQRCLAEQGAWPDELFASLKKLGQMSGIFLSGLFVGRSEPPVDILLVGKVSPAKLDQFLEMVYKLIGTEINYSVMSREEFDIRRNTFDRFIKDIFDYPYLVIMDKPEKAASASKTAKPAKKAAKKIK